MAQPVSNTNASLLALVTPVALIAVWAMVSSAQLFPTSLFPSPSDVARGVWLELRSGRLVNDAIASLFRVSAGFLLAVILGVPTGLLLGHSARARAAFLPLVNFFRSLSPLAWIPFAILWLGIGDPPAIFLIFMAAFFPDRPLDERRRREHSERVLPRRAGPRHRGRAAVDARSRCRPSPRRSSPHSASPPGCRGSWSSPPR